MTRMEICHYYNSPPTLDIINQARLTINQRFEMIPPRRDQYQPIASRNHMPQVLHLPHTAANMAEAQPTPINWKIILTHEPNPHTRELTPIPLRHGDNGRPPEAVVSNDSQPER